MKKIIVGIILTSCLWSNENFNELKSFQSNFKQTVTENKNQKIVYTGEIFANNENHALWVYKTPVRKEIYVTERNVLLIEPEIEQVIIKRISSTIDIFKMLKNAKFYKKDIFLLEKDNIEYYIYVDKDKTLLKITYIDEFSNNVTINFSNQKINRDIPYKIFIPEFPDYFDLIKS